MNTNAREARLADLAEDMLKRLLEGNPGWRFDVVLWDGRVVTIPRPTASVARVVILDAVALRSLFLGGSTLALAEAYLGGAIDFEGDLTEVISLGDQLLTIPASWKEKLAMAGNLIALPGRKAGIMEHEPARLPGKPGSSARNSAAISYHYDRPPEFWKSWLDGFLQYTCAYFRHEEDALDQAQEQKLELVCRKLGLTSGQRLLDIGCGWGGLMVYAARNHGVSCVGVTLSRAQADYARAWIEREGLTERCTVKLCDFREARDFGAFDAVSGVGVLEHLGPIQAKDYFATAFAVLRPGGRFFNQAIGASVFLPLRRGESFMDTYIFPDTELMPIHEALTYAEAAGFEVRDVENLREHYHLTLLHWLSRYEAAAEQIQAITSGATYRAFRLYLAGCAHDFKGGRIALYQSLFAKPEGGRSGFPLTRSFWLTDAGRRREDDK